jgi:hypothetical protein
MNTAGGVIAHDVRASGLRPVWVGLLLGIMVSAGLALMARGVIDHVPLYDELLHFLSARGLIATGHLAIAEGSYTRAQLFTRIVALFVDHDGATLVSARMPSLIFAMLLVWLLTTWLAPRLGWFGALVAGAVLCLLPPTIEIAVFARFYTLHALVVTIIAVLFYEAGLPQRSTTFRVSIAIAVLVLAALGLHLQDTTIIAVAAMGAGTLAVLAMDHWEVVGPILRRYPIRIGAGVMVMLSAGIAVGSLLGLTQRLMEAPLWAMHAAHRPFFYLVAFADTMPFLWAIFPVIAVIAWYSQRRLTLFCLVALVAAFIVHSIAAQKSIRYVYYILPLYCVVWGCAASSIVDWLRTLGSSNAMTERNRQLSVLLLFGVTIALSVEGQRAVKLALSRLTPREALVYAVEADWRSGVAVLQPLVSGASHVVTSNAMKSIYYFGRYDYELNASIVTETDTMEEFGKDERTGMQAIGTAASVDKVLHMPGKTLVVLENETMNLDSGVPANAVALIKERCVAIAVPVEAEISAWTCGSN